MKASRKIALFTIISSFIWPLGSPSSSVLVTQKLDLEFNRSEDVWGVYELRAVTFNNDTTKSLTVALFQNGQLQLISPQKAQRPGISDVVVENFAYTLNDKKDKITFSLENEDLERFKNILLSDHVKKTEDYNLTNLKILSDSIECDRSFKTIKCSLMLQ